MASASQSQSPPAGGYVKGLRWWICALLFFATTINYIDRTSLGLLKDMLSAEFNWSEGDYGWVLFGFTTAYALFPSFAGMMIDKYGLKITFAAGVVLWSLMCMAHAVVPALVGATTGIKVVVGFAIVRFLLGAAETTNFPASIKAVAQWFPQRDRAMATGIFNSGTNVAVMTSFVTVGLAEKFGWRLAFVIIGAFGFIWLVLWQWLYRSPEDHPMLSPEELALIRSDQPQPTKMTKVPWNELLRHNQIWPFLIGKFLTDPVWWFYLYWLPTYLSKKFYEGKNMMKVTGILFVIYGAATVGSIAGGWVSGFFMRRGWSVGRARLTAMLICALAMPGSILAYYADSRYLCIGLICLATAGHQGWSANIFTMASDFFPSRLTGSITGLGAMTGAIGGMFMVLLVPLSIEWTHGTQQVAFIWAGLMHPFSLALFYFWIGKDYKTVDTEKHLDMTKSYTPLITGGLFITALGAALTFLIYSRWADFIKIAMGEKGDKGTSTAWAGATAAVGVILIGLVLVYGGMGRKHGRSS